MDTIAVHRHLFIFTIQIKLQGAKRKRVNFTQVQLGLVYPLCNFEIQLTSCLCLTANIVTTLCPLSKEKVDTGWNYETPDFINNILQCSVPSFQYKVATIKGLKAGICLKWTTSWVANSHTSQRETHAFRLCITLSRHQGTPNHATNKSLMLDTVSREWYLVSTSCSSAWSCTSEAPAARYSGWTDSPLQTSSVLTLL